MCETITTTHAGHAQKIHTHIRETTLPVITVRLELPSNFSVDLHEGIAKFIKFLVELGADIEQLVCSGVVTKIKLYLLRGVSLYIYISALSLCDMLF